MNCALVFAKDLLGEVLIGYYHYRYTVLARMKSLKFLDSNQITPAERTEAEKYYSRVARVDASQVRIFQTLGE